MPPANDPNILIVEDDPVASYFARSVLASESSRIYLAQTIAQARSVLTEAAMSLVITDLLLPDGDGREFLTTLRSDPRTATIPVIVLTARAGSQAKIDCFSLGADSYFEKPIEGPVLRAAVAQALRRSETVRREALRDPLTGLGNRVGFTQAVDEVARDATRTRGAVAALLDVDRFHAVNTARGHAAADELLQAVGAAIAEAVGPDASVARWAGDQFAVVFSNATIDEAVARVDRARVRVAALPEGAGPGAPKGLTMSAGVADIPGGGSAAALMTELDALLFRAKSGGRDRTASRLQDTPATPRSILVAEDDPVISTLLRHRLAKAGFRVILAADGRRALEVLESERPDLAVIDVLMPDIDGFELLARLRETPEHARMPVLILTSLANDGDVERGLSLGADDYVVKPFSPVELLARIHRLLGR